MGAGINKIVLRLITCLVLNCIPLVVKRPIWTHTKPRRRIRITILVICGLVSDLMICKLWQAIWASWHQMSLLGSGVIKNSSILNSIVLWSIHDVCTWMMKCVKILFNFFQKRLMNAAKKAITKMPVRTMKSGDKVGHLLTHFTHCPTRPSIYPAIHGPSIMVAHGRVVTNSRQITEVKQRRAWLVLGWMTASHWLVFESCCRPCVEVSGKPLILCHLSPPSSDGYLVKQEQIVTGYS